MKNLYLILGAPLSGKGTQSKKIKEEFNFIHISTGDLIRSEIEKKTELGLELQLTIAEGNLVCDSIMNRLLSNTLQDYSSGNFLLDGYPRTYPQLLYLQSKDNVKIRNVVFLNVEKHILLERAKSRFLEEKREDDRNIDSVLNRIEIFETQTKSIVNDFPEEIVINVDGSHQPNTVFNNIKDKLVLFP